MSVQELLAKRLLGSGAQQNGDGGGLPPFLQNLIDNMMSKMDLSPEKIQGFAQGIRDGVEDIRLRLERIEKTQELILEKLRMSESETNPVPGDLFPPEMQAPEEFGDCEAMKNAIPAESAQ